MLITIEFLEDFENVSRGTKTSFDAEFNDSIENLKVIISLKYHEIEVSSLNILLKGKILKDQATLNSLNIQQGTVLQARKRRVMGCNIF